MAIGDLLWGMSLLAMVIGGFMFRRLPPDRWAAAWGLATGVLLALFVVAMVSWHAGVCNCGFGGGGRSQCARNG